MKSNDSGPLPSIIFYCLYLSIYSGYFLSILLINLFDQINKTDLFRSIEFRKKFNFKNIIKSVINFLFKHLKNWLNRINKKFLLLIDNINKIIRAFKTCKKNSSLFLNLDAIFDY